MKIKCKMDMKSMATLFSNMKGVLSMAIIEGGEAMYEFATDVIMLQSAEECPKDTWTLVSTGYVNRPVIMSNSVVVELGYGGTEDKKNPKSGLMASQYAVEVHENLLYKHPVGNAKFFENPVKRNEMGMPMHVAGRIGWRSF